MRHRAHRYRRAGRSMRTPAQPKCWTDSSQRATLLWHRLHRHGVGRGTVVKLARRERPLPCPPSSASPALYRGVPTATSAHTDGVSADIPVTARARCVARACLAALQGGQAGAHPDQSKVRPTGTVRLNLPCIKTATSPANRGGSWPAFTAHPRGRARVAGLAPAEGIAPELMRPRRHRVCRTRRTLTGQGFVNPAGGRHPGASSSMPSMPRRRKRWIPRPSMDRIARCQVRFLDGLHWIAQSGRATT